MNNKNIEKLIPKAIDLLQKFPKEKVYQGYLASFGPTVITSGIVQAVAFFNGDDKKNEVIKLMFNLIKELPTITAKKMSETLSVSQRTVERDLSALKNKGEIEKAEKIEKIME